jgi:hypothetical protein
MNYSSYLYTTMSHNDVATNHMHLCHTSSYLSAEVVPFVHFLAVVRC